MEVLFIKLLNMSITAGWIVLGVFLLRLALKKAPRWAVCALWALVGVRLVCPVSFESVLSLIPSAETISPNILYSSAPQIQSGIDFINSAVNPALSESFAPDVYASANPMQIAAFIASAVWLFGAAAMLLYAAFSYFRLRRRVAAAVLFSDNLWQSEAVSSPFVLGFFRPRVYLPFGLDEGAMACIASHERAHIKRRDHLIKPAAYFLLCVYWFNPLIWLAYILLCRDIELACDERVIKDMGADGKKAYSRALLSFGAARSAVLACPLAFGEVGIKLRVKNVLNYRKPAFWIIIAALILCAAASIMFLSNPKTLNHLDDGLNASVSSPILSENSGGNDKDFQAQAHVVLDTRQSGLNRVTYTRLSFNRSIRRLSRVGMSWYTAAKGRLR